MEQQRSNLTPLGKLISLVLVLGLIGGGIYMVMSRFSGGDSGSGSGSNAGSGSSSGGDSGDAPAIVDFKSEVPRLAAAQPFTMKDNVVPIEISEYAGYAGLIAANGGLEPSENSVFFKQGGFKVKLTISEDESWSDLNQGKIAGSVTTVDVLAAYGRQFHAVVPVQIGFSRGADGLIVTADIKKVNDLKGKIVATSQFTEADFFLRYLAQEAGLTVNVINSLDAAPSADRLNVVYTAEGGEAGELFLHDIKSGGKKLSGAMTWEPTVSEVVEGSGGAARVLVSNKNLLVVGDVMVLHRGFAEANPKIVQGLVQGVLEGNRMVRDNRDAHLDTIAKAFKWTRDDARDELAKVHLSNLPENLAFFSGAIDAAGSFGGIYQSAVLAYGPDLIKDPPDADRFASLAALKAIEAGGAFKDQKVAITPIRSGKSGTLETSPLLSKDIRFLFEPNSATLDLEEQSNLTNLDQVKKMLQVSPGSTILLRGHVDNAMIEQIRKQGGEALVRSQALKAMELSKRRAAEIKQMLITRLAVDAPRIEVVGRGWEEPVSTNSDDNRRVEVQWFTIE
jgi:NitT/TauT family transport system substrate-binding protein